MASWKPVLRKEEREFIGNIAIDNENKIMNREMYEDISASMRSHFGNQWTYARTKVAFAIVRKDLGIEAPKGHPGKKPKNLPVKKDIFGRGPLDINVQINSIFDAAMCKMRKAFQRKEKEYQAETERLKKEITDLKYQLRELANIRKAVESYQQR